MAESVEELLKEYKHPLTSEEIVMKLYGKKSRCAIYLEIKNLLKHDMIKREETIIGKFKRVFYVRKS